MKIMRKTKLSKLTNAGKLAGVNLSKNPGCAGDSPIFLSLRTSRQICLVRQASEANLTSNDDSFF